MNSVERGLEGISHRKLGKVLVVNGLMIVMISLMMELVLVSTFCDYSFLYKYKAI